MRITRYAHAIRFALALFLAIAIGGPVPALAASGGSDEDDLGADGDSRGAIAIEARERHEVIAAVDRFEEDFARSLELGPLLDTHFVGGTFARPEDDAYADLGPAISDLLERDQARRRRLQVGLASVALLAEMESMSRWDLSAPELSDACLVSEETRGVQLEWEESLERLDESAATMDSAESALDRFLDATDALSREIATYVPRGAMDRALVASNRSWLEANGRTVVRLAAPDSAAGAERAFEVIRGGLYYRLARVPDGIKVLEIGPSHD
jgi:hypothetical protein